ncbi:hypothetical protein CXU21_00560 [Akkermansia muciniphila]|nr:hypothetical protein CXU21_00560 [Akkermansia muciniphila]
MFHLHQAPAVFLQRLELVYLPATLPDRFRTRAFYVKNAPETGSKPGMTARMMAPRTNKKG